MQLQKQSDYITHLTANSKMVTNNRLMFRGCNEASTTTHKLRDDGCCFDRPAFPTWQCPWTENNIIYALGKETTAIKDTLTKSIGTHAELRGYR